MAVSSGMVASFALPASAAPLATVKPKAPNVVGALVIAAPSAAEAPLVSPSFGNIGFSGVNKPKPKPVAPRPAVSRTADRASRSATRLPVATSAPTPAPRSGGVLGIAASLAGIYYIYGGTTTAGFDCSGFTQYVFGKVGISLPRTAEQQRQFVTPVSNPQPGDLVFFGAPAHHMGIYAGNGMMWDSPHTGAAISKRAIYSTSVTYGRA
jgi:cell wall-associated NlpC family hydrolase